MKRMTAFLLCLFLILTLVSCQEQGGSVVVSGDKIASYKDSPLPTQAVYSEGCWYVIAQTETAYELHCGADPKSPELRVALPDGYEPISMQVEGQIGFIVAKADRDFRIAVFQPANPTLDVWGTVSPSCPDAVICNGSVYCINEDQAHLEKVFFSAQGALDRDLEFPVGDVTALGEDGGMIVYNELLPDGQTVCIYSPGSGGTKYKLPSSVSVIESIDYNLKAGTFVFCYKDATTGSYNIGSWFVTGSEVHSLFAFGNDYHMTAHPIEIHNGTVYWVTAAKIPGMEREHFRVIGWNLETGAPIEFMKAFAFSVSEDGLNYLTYDVNNRIDRISLYRADLGEEKAE